MSGESATASHALRLALTSCRRGLWFAALFSFVINLLLLTTPIYMMQVFDRVVTSSSVDTLLYLTLVALGALFSLGLLEIARSHLLVRISAFVEGTVAPAAFETSLHNSLRGRSYRSEAVRDLRELRGFLTGQGILSLFDLPWTPLFMVVIFLLHPVLGMVCTVSLVLLVMLALLNDRLSRARFGAAGEISMRVMQELETFNRNAEIIDALGMMPAIKRRWLERSGKALRLQAEANASVGTVQGFSKFCRLFVQIVILATGAWLLMAQEVTGGAMIAGSIMLARALAPIDHLIASWRQLVGVHAAYRRLDHALQQEPLRPAGLRLPAPEGELRLEQVSFTSQATNRQIIADITFDIAPGDTLAIVGPSAAGKTTLARLIVGVIAPTSGHVRLDGADVFPWNRDDLGRHIGYLPQDVTLFPGTVAENIARLRDAEADEIIEAAQRANVHNLILRLPKGYDTEIGDGGVRLSGGQRQRIALARALFGRPSLVLLDEPNANLDGEGDAALVRALGELRSLGTTVVFITHRPGLIAYADKLLLVRDGVSELFGPRQEIMSQLRPHAVSPTALWRPPPDDRVVVARERG